MGREIAMRRGETGALGKRSPCTGMLALLCFGDVTAEVYCSVVPERAGSYKPPNLGMSPRLCLRQRPG
jgi:hypothetical protein